MAILRDTRARIDPALLAVMKDKLSAGVVPQKPVEKEPQPLKQGLFKRDYKTPEPPATATPTPVDTADEYGMVPVDKQKIAQIVLQYMKNREDKQKH